MYRRFRRVFLVALGWMVLATGSSFGQLNMQNVGGARGFQVYQPAVGMGSGAAAADYDGDGYVDVFIPTGNNTPDLLYRNLGNGNFVEYAPLIGLNSTDNDRAALWIDYDGDGDLDLITVGDCFDPENPVTLFCGEPSTIHLFRQEDNGTFVDVTAEAGLDIALIADNKTHFGSICAGDINNDEYPDLYLTVWSGTSRLLLNNTNGGFVDITASSNLPSGGSQWQAMMYDFNGDGRLDIYAAVDFTANYLWINQGDNTFLDMAQAAGVDNAMNDMGMDLDDYDNDGDIDIFVTNINHYDTTLQTEEYNVLYRNDSVGGVLSFTEVAELTGVADADWGWGATFCDADNDRRLDLAVTNGFIFKPWDSDSSRLFHNLGGDPVTFSDASTPSGFDDAYWGSTVISFDFDRDGDMDLLQTAFSIGEVRLMENDGAGVGNYLVVKPRLNGPNSHAIGAVVRVAVGGTSLMRLITAGTSFMGQEPAEAFFGLDAAKSVDSVSVEWPDGRVTTLSNVDTNQVITITEEVVPCADVQRLKTKCTGNGVVWAKVLMTSTDHDGKTVKLTVDGVPYDVTIQGRTAALRVSNMQGAGAVSVELTYPVFCSAPVELFCP